MSGEGECQGGVGMSRGGSNEDNTKDWEGDSPGEKAGSPQGEEHVKGVECSLGSARGDLDVERCLA